MLVLSRRKNEVLLIGDNIRLHVVGISRSSVKLAIEAPREVPVHRGEVRQRFEADRFDAANWVQFPAGDDELLPA